MKRKGFVAFSMAVGMSLSLPLLSYAGEWKQDTTGWWWQNDDGTYPVSRWKWIDGNNDGIAERYYFNENGYCLMNTKTPDGLTVNENGAWLSIGTGMVLTKDASMLNQSGSVAGLYKPVEGTQNGETKQISGKLIDIEMSEDGSIREGMDTTYGPAWIDYFPQTGDREWTYTSYEFTYTTTMVYYFPDDNTLIETRYYSYGGEPVIIKYVKQ